MSKNAYLFIDGNYLLQRQKDVGDKWFGGDVIPIDYQRLAHGFKKVFFYDALPGKWKNESPEDFEKRRTLKEMHFGYLRSLDGWHVIEGISKRSSGNKAEQKEVDILIAVDMLTHTHRRNMESLTFIAGDQDFRPLLDAVVREGMYVELWYAASSFSPELRTTADARRRLTASDWWHYTYDSFRAFHAFPNIVRSGTEQQISDASLVATGKRGSQVVAELWRNAESGMTLMKDVQQGYYTGQYAGLHWNRPDLDQYLKDLWNHLFCEGTPQLPLVWSPA